MSGRSVVVALLFTLAGYLLALAGAFFRALDKEQL